MNLGLDEIVVLPNRQRSEFNAEEIVRLADSIENLGLLHPIVVRRVGEKWILVAGERRLMAVKLLFGMGQAEGFILATDIGELSPLQIVEAELEENIRRIDLTWQERATATSKLELLRRSQAELFGDEPPSVADIAKEVRGSSEGVHQENTRKELIVAKHLGNPGVAAAKTVDEAFKLLKRQENIKRNEQIARDLGPRFHKGIHRLELGDFREKLSGTVENRFDVLVCDPPYGIGADEFGDCGGKATGGAHLYNDSYGNWIDLMKDFVEYSYRFTKEQSHCYIFCDFERFNQLRARMIREGWSVFRTPIIWYKPNGNRIPWVDRGPQRQYELILFASKGGKLVQKHGSDVITCRADVNLGHQAQKPVALYQELLSRSAVPGDKVADFFCGTGPIFPAAHALKCEATGFDLDKASYGIAATRIEELV